MGVVATSGSLNAAEWIQPIEPVKGISLGQMELDNKLYFGSRLSKLGFISCNSCHDLSMGGTDNLKTSIGHNWQQGPINAPMVRKSSFTAAQFRDGRAADLKARAGGPIANSGEMAFTHTLDIFARHSAFFRIHTKHLIRPRASEHSYAHCPFPSILK